MNAMETHQRRLHLQRRTSNSSLSVSETSSDTFSFQIGGLSTFDSGSSYVTDDESYNTSFDLASHSSFGQSNNEKIDDTSLALLIGKLKGSLVSENGAPAPMDDTESVGSSSTSGSLEDDAIAVHLKALASCTTKRSSQRYPSPSAADNDGEVMAAEDSGEEDDNEEEGDDEEEEEEEEEAGEEAAAQDEESVDESAYAAVDDFVKKFGVQIDDENEADRDYRQYLEMIALQGHENPGGLSQLASDLLEEDSSSDEESQVTVNVTTSNIDRLLKVAQSADKIISASRKEQEKMTTWRVQQRKQVRIASNGSLELDSHDGKKTPLPYPSTSCPVSSQHSAEDNKGSELGSHDRSHDMDSVFTPVDKLVPNDNYGMPWAFGVDDSPVGTPLEVVVRQSSNKRKQQRANKGSPTKINSSASTDKKELPPRPPSWDRKRSNPAKPLDGDGEPPKTPAPVSPKPQPEDQKEIKPERPVKKVSGKAPKSKQKVVIPQGYPPYPGYGPKWPFHPYSPNAPKGYKECYMHHMGEHYFKYMEFLRTRDNNQTMDKYEADNIHRNSLVTEGKFKPKKSKPQPVLSPYTFTSKPGKARKNCAVPVTMPKIDEGSNSSTSEAKPKRVDPRITKPQVVSVGKHHPKSKGKKGKIVVRSGAELDQRANKKSAPTRKTKNAPKATRHSVSDSKSAVSQEQASPSGPAAVEQQCACVVM